ncbi:3-keto-disaccharide hydrolase [Verrucomicrobium spinosum]|uniref:3-keto-disaccharide hydrolase n=1 Tax=Verrucomicrobium spinosum TaxID=2736 RepID=UPI0001746BF0|nr:DUF1080 domain-containing protein [Verrucomicrobium spinosum]
MPLPAILRPFYRALPLLALVSLIPLTSPAADEGFTSLFDGSTFAGWKAETATGYQAEKGVLRCTPEGKHLVSEKTYGNFHLKFEFKLSEGANNGMGIRCDDIKPGSKAAPHLNGMEIQIIDANVPKHATIKDWQHHGSIYGVVPARREGMKPVGEWNTEEIIAQGTRVKVILNGVTIVDADLATQKPIDGHEHPGLLNKEGHLVICGHKDPVEFKNLQIKTL